jgi:hypothetical protein
MKNLKKVLAMVLVVAMVASFAVTASAKTFTDAESINYTTAVEVLSGLGVIDGKTDGAFHPTDDVTRGQFAKMAAYVLNGGSNAATSYASSATTAFSDVASTHYAAASIGYVVNKGLVDGFTDNTFRPDNSVTGVQAAKILLTALGYKSDVEGYTGTTWAQNVQTDAEEAGLFAGIENIDLTANLTREQAAQMIWNALQATTVSYAVSGTTITTSDGTTITTGASAAAPTGSTLALKAYKAMITTDDTNTADYGRPATAYKLGTKTIATEVATPVATYSSNFTKAAETALLKTYTTAGGYTVTYNGGTDAGLATLSDLYAANGKAINGYEIEIYADSDKNITDVVVIEGYLAKVGTVTAATKKANATVVVTVYEAGYAISNSNAAVSFTLTDDPDSTTDLYDIVTGSFSTGDYIVAYCHPGWNVATADKAFIEFAATTSVNGKITRVNNAGDTSYSSILLDGTSYPTANEYISVTDATHGVGGTSGLPTVGNTGTLYLLNGNVIGYVKDASSSTGNTSILVTKTYQTLEDGVLVTKVTGIVASGETQTFSLKNGDPTPTAAAAGCVYDYTANADGTYSFTAVTNTTVGDGKTVKLYATTSIATTDLKHTDTATSATYYFGTDMKVVYMDGTVVTGKQLITSKQVYAVVSVAGGVNTFTTLYVEGKQETDTTVTSDAIVFVAAKDTTTSTILVNDVATPIYTYTAYIAGEEVDEFVSADSITPAGFYQEVKDSATGLYVLTGKTYTTAAGATAVKNGPVTAFASNILTVGGVDIDVSGAKIVDLSTAEDGITTSANVWVIFNSTTGAAAYVYVVDR